MVTPTFDIHPGRGTTQRARPDGQVLRHRLDVIAVGTDDVVHGAGGWLYDRVMAGWQVNVLLPHGCDTRPLRVLGLRVLDADFDVSGPMGQGLAVSVKAFAADERVRALVRKAVASRLTEVALWGEGWPLGADRGLTRTRYTLTAAARAFKAQALRAVGMSYESIDSTETLVTDSAWLG
ncbi:MULTISPECIES: hypothetical protein [unclassified Mycobacterium]|uniref:hypothetical protein n=1 Tax=unclassified Mycobacterium TaxID=2642494 RepID=UPI002740CF3C|nr:MULTISPECIES: hypothetical protein [unclassified Mycobacterium]MDP7704495.1 hypothetical protein [Mycobacterium sp. TY815]MDP7722965.1 hypothetical protein [Mycobacterium sp. TY814]